MELRESTLKQRKLNAPHWNHQIHKYECYSIEGESHLFYKMINSALSIYFNQDRQRINIDVRYHSFNLHLQIHLLDLFIRLHKYRKYHEYRENHRGKYIFYDLQYNFICKLYYHYELYVVHPKRLVHMDKKRLTGIRIGTQEYMYLKSDISLWYAFAAAHHWKSKYRRKQWLKKNREFCKLELFFPYFWQMLVYYLH